MAAGPTYSSIATTTLGSAAASYTFTSIPSTYTDLVMVVQTRHSGSGDGNWVQALPNSSTASSYGNTYLQGSGTTATSGRYSSRNDGYFIGLCNSTSLTIITTQFMNYANSTTYKTAISRSNASSTDGTMALVHLWAQTTAISSIKVQIESGSVNLVAGSILSLYGIAAA